MTYLQKQTCTIYLVQVTWIHFCAFILNRKFPGIKKKALWIALCWSVKYSCNKMKWIFKSYLRVLSLMFNLVTFNMFRLFIVITCFVAIVTPNPSSCKLAQTCSQCISNSGWIMILFTNFGCKESNQKFKKHAQRLIIMIIQCNLPNLITYIVIIW